MVLVGDAIVGGVFFSGLFITRMRPIRSWREYVQSVSCLPSAQWRLIASSPLPSAPACPKKMWFAPRRLQKKRKKRERGGQRQGQRKEHRPAPKRLLRMLVVVPGMGT